MHPPQQQHQPYAGPPMPPPRRKPKARGWLIAGAVVLVLLVAVLVAAALSAGGKPSATATPSPSTSYVFAEAVPKPNADQAEVLLRGLREIDPGLDRARSIDRARNTCWSILEGLSRAQVVKSTRLRFDGATRVTSSDAEKIVKLVEGGGWCHK